MTKEPKLQYDFNDLLDKLNPKIKRFTDRVAKAEILIELVNSTLSGLELTFVGATPTDGSCYIGYDETDDGWQLVVDINSVPNANLISSCGDADRSGTSGCLWVSLVDASQDVKLAAVKSLPGLLCWINRELDELLTINESN